jgi:hypothetical protein
MYQISPGHDSKMTQEQNQQPKVKLGTCDQNTELKEPPVTTQALPNVNSQTACQIFATSSEESLKALARLIVSFASSIPELSESKYSNHQGN